MNKAKYEDILHFPNTFQEELYFNAEFTEPISIDNPQQNTPLLNQFIKRETGTASLYNECSFQQSEPLILPFSPSPLTASTTTSVENSPAHSVGYQSSFSCSSSPAESIAYSPVQQNSNDSPGKSEIEIQANNIRQCQPPEYGIIDNFPVELEYVKFPEKLYKIQKRIRGKSEQRIQKSVVEFSLDFLDLITLNLAIIRNLQIYVKRSKEVKNSAKYVGPIKLQPSSITHLEGTCKYLIKVDLDSVYEVDGKKVYQLQKTSTEELNVFHLLIDIALSDGRQRTIKSKEFLLIGKKTDQLNTNVQSTLDSIDSCESASVSSSGYGTSTAGDEDVLRASTIVADHIKTKSLKIGDLVIGNTIQSHHGDIAYHFPLNDSDEFFKEGEVVGFYQNEKENKMKIVRLTSETASDASLKGVITRSQYLEAMKPKNSKIVTETVCMLGIVPVKVLGVVKANDPLYASKTEPGIAVSGYHHQCQNVNDDSLIGYAFQSFKPSTADEIGFVQAGVSVLNSASQLLLNKHIKRLENHWDRRIKNLQKTNTKFKRCIISSGLVVFFVSVLTGIFLWQLLTPGSQYRYYKCRQGSIPGREVTFSYNPGKFTFTWVKVNGLQFEFTDLIKKTGNYQYKPMNVEENARYYLNIDYCAYGGTRATEDISTGQKVVYGPDIFAVDSECKKSYYYVEWQTKWLPLFSITFIDYNKSEQNRINYTCTS